MAQITETGVLPIGIEIDGKIHRDFEVRPRLVGHQVEVYAEHKDTELENSAFLGTCLLAKQIVRLGDITKVTPEMLLQMYDEDCAAIREASGRLSVRLKSFRSRDEGSKEAAPGAPEAKNTVSGGDRSPGR